MPSVRHLLNGVEVQVAKRRRICHRNRRKHSISAGMPCLVISDPNSGGSKNYCPECATAILDQVDQDAAKLRAALEASSQE